MGPYLPLVLLFALAAGFAMFSVTARALRRPAALQPREARRLRVRHRADPAAGRGGGRFPVEYYLTAMLFILFDIEIVFLYPWAVSVRRAGVFGLVEMVLFIVTVSRRLRLRLAARRAGLGLGNQTWVSKRSCPAASC